MRADLKRLSIAGVKQAFADAESPQVKSLAVLPFNNMSGDQEQEYFSDGLTEEIINALTQLPGLKVAARTSSFFFRAKERDIREIGAKLNVENVLEGSVRKAGNRIRITAQLISISDGYHLWSERYDREMTDVFAVQDEISRAIAEKLSVQLAGSRPMVKRPTDNMEAYSLYLRGHYQCRLFTPDALAKSREHFEQAIALDPEYALPWCGLASYYYLLGWFGHIPSKQANKEAKQANHEALALDETLSEAHTISGLLRALDYDWQGAERDFTRALELDPQSEDTIDAYCFFYLVPMRRFDEAIALTRKALERDPLSALLQFHLGYWHFFARQYERAIEHSLISVELNPNYISPHGVLAACYSLMGKPEEAIRAIETFIQLSGRVPLYLGILGEIYSRSGRIGEAVKLLAELQELQKKIYVPPTAFARIYEALGEIDKALDWCERAIDERDSWIFHLRVDSGWDSLRSHPRFHALLRKMNLQP
jgi:serine/threonine-protein kinase